MIPRRFIRTIPVDPSEETEVFWKGFQDIHSNWEFVTYQDPIDVSLFPISSSSWNLCGTGAQMAGLIRLEALWNLGGFYVDSDVECYRSFEPLTYLDGVAGWEDSDVVPDAIMGAKAQHPVIEECLKLAIQRVNGGHKAWMSGPGVTTELLPWRPDWLLLPPGSFYPYLYTEKEKRNEDHRGNQPWAFAAHHWAGSWVGK